jgi:hypothetical protein
MKSYVFLILLIILVQGMMECPQAQVGSSTRGYGSVQGHVVCEDDGSPGRLGKVRLVPIAWLLTQERKKAAEASAPQYVGTDFNGDYIFPSVQQGTYVLEVLQDGYSRDFSLLRQMLANFGPEKQRALLAEFPQVTVLSGGVSRVDTTVQRAGVIGGQVSFDDGGVASAVEVTATLLSTSRFNDDQSLKADVIENLGFSSDARTDDQGNYRIIGLPRGRYRVEVVLREPFFTDSRPPSLGSAELTVFAPNVLSKAESTLAEVHDGENLAEVNINIPMRKLHSVSGFVMQHGRPLTDVKVWTRPAGQKESGSWTWRARTITDGSYRLDLVPSGTYTVEADYFEKAGSSRPSAMNFLTVIVGDSDVRDANLDLSAQQSSK